MPGRPAREQLSDSNAAAPGPRRPGVAVSWHGPGAPAVQLDLDRLDANIARFHRPAQEAGVGVRAHVKAHRCPAVTTRLLGAGAAGVALQFAGEVAHHVAAGARDVVVAWPWTGAWRLRLIAAAAGECRLAVHVAAAQTVAELAAAARAAGTVVAVRLEVDVGAGRGLDAEQCVRLAREVAGTAGIRLDGVTGYAALTTPDAGADRFAIGRAAATTLVGIAETIRAAGIDCPVVCVGGTPTAAGALTVAGVTELCAGAYPLLDAGLAALGHCGLDDVAIAVAGEGGAELLDGCHQPFAPEVDAVRRDDRLLPGHTCPMMHKVPEVTAVRGGTAVERWPVVCPIDRDSGRAT